MDESQADGQPAGPHPRPAHRLQPPAFATAAESVLRFFLSTDETLDDFDSLLDEVPVPALAPEESVKIQLNVPLAQGRNAQGNFVIAVLDVTNVVPEVNEKNNIVVMRYGSCKHRGSRRESLRG